MLCHPKNVSFLWKNSTPQESKEQYSALSNTSRHLTYDDRRYRWRLINPSGVWTEKEPRNRLNTTGRAAHCTCNRSRFDEHSQHFHKTEIVVSFSCGKSFEETSHCLVLKIIEWCVKCTQTRKNK